MRLLPQEKATSIPLVIGVSFVFIFSALLYFSPPPVEKMLNFLEYSAYDWQVQYAYRPVSHPSPVLIVDVDDASLATEGRWPWSRKKIARLVSQLFEMGAKVVALDMMFAEPEENSLDEVLHELKERADFGVISELENERPYFDFDQVFAKSLNLGNSILGFIFTGDKETQRGKLPYPTLVLSDEQANELFISNNQGYIADIPILQTSAKGGGFINIIPDTDGIIRYCHLLFRMEKDVYSSLAFEATRLFMNVKDLGLETANYGNGLVLEGIRLGDVTIPTDPWGRILIPFRGPAFSMPYISAEKILNQTIKKEEIENKLVFVGSSASAMGDFAATAIAPVFVGVEVHANIAASLLDGYLPSRPAWGKGVSTFLVLLLGMFCALFYPRMGAIGITVATFLLCSGLVFLNWRLWIDYALVFTFAFPLFTIMVLYALNIVCGYFFETTRRKTMKSIFGQYVPPERIDTLLKEGGDFGLEGQNKELTVLFADIRNFTTIAEALPAPELKKLLNDFFNPMTQVIFEHKGTIDKYVGDMVMAFWGAPLEDPNSSYNAVVSALAMQEKLKELNQAMQEKGGPHLRIGVGVNTGSMNVGDMGSQFRRAYTVLGDSVNLASRLEALCRFYDVRIIVGESTFQKTEKDFGYRKIDRVKVKGKGKAVDIYEPICQLNQCSSQTLSLLEMHKKAIDAYFKRNWDEAQSLFTQLLANDPESSVLYQIFLKRLGEYQKSTPLPEWDGTFVLEGK